MPQTHHTAPCEGLQDIQILSAKMEERLDNMEAQQTDALKRVESKVDHVTQQSNEFRIERFNQLSTITQKMSADHDSLVSLVNANYNIIRENMAAERKYAITTMIQAIAATAAIVGVITAVISRIMGH